MIEVENLLGSLKTELNQLNIPAEMESRMRIALENRSLPSLPRRYWKAGLAVSLLMLLVIWFQRDNIADSKILTFFSNEKSRVQEQNVLETSLPMAKSTVDVQKEKEKLAQEGYVIKREGENSQEHSDSSFALADIMYVSTLKDIVYNSKSASKGEVLGIKYFVASNFNNLAYTKAKVLITESYDQKYKAGDIITIIKTGGIITHYEQIVKDEIDKKFQIPQADLEESKHKLVVADNYDGNLLYPEDKIVFFDSQNPLFEEDGEDSSFIIGPVVKFSGDEILNKVKDKRDVPFVWEEFYSGSLSDLEGRIRQTVERKKSYSKDKAQQAAYQALNDTQRQAVLALESADVLYREKGIYEERGIKTPDGTIQVIFKTSKGFITVDLVDDNYKVFGVREVRS